MYYPLDVLYHVRRSERECTHFLVAHQTGCGCCLIRRGICWSHTVSQDVRDLATDITQHGAQLAELLAKEDQLRDARQAAISRNLQMTDVEKIVKQSISAAEENMNSKAKLMQDLKTDEQVRRSERPGCVSMSVSVRPCVTEIKKVRMLHISPADNVNANSELMPE